MAAEQRPIDLLKFFLYAGQLKRTYRTGWVLENLPSGFRVESVAEHSYRVAIMAMCLLPAELDRQKCINMALIHDLAESVIGDLCPSDSAELLRQKPELEQRAMEQICSLLPGADLRDYILGLFREFEEKSSAEALAVKDLDLLDMMIQSCEYDLLLDRAEKLRLKFSIPAFLKLHNRWAIDFGTELLELTESESVQLPPDSNTPTYWRHIAKRVQEQMEQEWMEQERMEQERMGPKGMGQEQMVEQQRVWLPSDSNTIVSDLNHEPMVEQSIGQMIDQMVAQTLDNRENSAESPSDSDTTLTDLDYKPMVDSTEQEQMVEQREQEEQPPPSSS